jgi:hypothetical protein
MASPFPFELWCACPAAVSGGSVTELLMKTCTPSPAWDGSPFADAFDRAMWEAGIVNSFATEAEAQEAIALVLRERPDLRGLALRFEEVA